MNSNNVIYTQTFLTDSMVQFVEDFRNESNFGKTIKNDIGDKFIVTMASDDILKQVSFDKAGIALRLERHVHGTYVDGEPDVTTGMVYSMTGWFYPPEPGNLEIDNADN